MVEDDEKIRKPLKLNFNRIYKVNFNDRNSEAIQNLVDEFDNLPNYEPGRRNAVGKGFENFENDFDIEFDIYSPHELVSQMNTQQSISNRHIIAKRFRYEIYSEGRDEPQIREADIFWIKPRDILLIKGGDKASEQIFNYLAGFTSAGFKQIEFADEFLLWMSYKYEKFDGKLSNNLIFEKMDKTRTMGIETNENDITVKEALGMTIPLPTMYGLLNEQNLYHIGGDFQFRDYRINAKLAQKMSIYVYSLHALNGKTYSEKCAFSFPFILEIIEIFENWDGRDVDDDKFPDDDFFEDTIKKFKKQIDYSIEKIEVLKEKYRNLRNGVENVP